MNAEVSHVRWKATGSRHDSIAEAFLNGLQQALEAKEPIHRAIEEAYDKPLAAAKKFERKHPDVSSLHSLHWEFWL